MLRSSSLLLVVLLFAACRSTPEPAPEPKPVAVGSSVSDSPPRGAPCPEGTCANGLECRQYYGIAGPRGPPFTQCVVPCEAKGRCPEGETCISVSDGPGRICQPEHRREEAAPAPADR